MVRGQTVLRARSEGVVVVPAVMARPAYSSVALVVRGRCFGYRPVIAHQPAQVEELAAVQGRTVARASQDKAGVSMVVVVRAEVLEPRAVRVALGNAASLSSSTRHWP